MTAVRKSERRFGLLLGVEAFADFLGAAGRLEQRDSAVGADHFKASVAIMNVRLRCLKQCGSDFLAFGEHHVGGMHDCSAGAHRRARTDRRKSRKSLRSVAVTMLDRFWLNAEPACKQAWENRRVALAGRLHVAAQDQLVAAGKRNRGLLHWQGAGVLQHKRHTDAAQLLALRGLASTLVEIGEIRKLQRLVDDRREIATVVNVDWGLEWHCRRRNEIFLAQPYRIHSDNPRRFFHHALKRVVRFWPP